MKILLLLFELVTLLRTGYSIKCHRYQNSPGKEPIDDSVDCTAANNAFPKILECLKKKNDEVVSKLASEFHDLHQECLANFADSCYHDRYNKIADCTCLGGYMASIKHIDAKMGECKKLTPAEWIDHQFKTHKMFNDVKRLADAATQLNCLPTKIRRSSLQKLLIPEKKHQTLTHEVCTCQTDLCNEIDKTSEPDYPECSQTFGNGTVQTMYCDQVERIIGVGLGCVVEERSGQDAALAQKYFASFKECLERFKGCVYLGDINRIDCICNAYYFSHIKPLNMKNKECKDVDSQLIKPEEEKIEKLYPLVQKCLLSLNSSLPSGKSDWATKSIESRRSETFKVCTCDSNNCDPIKESPEQTSTAVSENTTKPNQVTGSSDGAGNGQDSSTKKDGSNEANGQDKTTTKDGSDVSENDESNGSSDMKSTTIHDLILIALEIILICKCTN